MTAKEKVLQKWPDAYCAGDYPLNGKEPIRYDILLRSTGKYLTEPCKGGRSIDEAWASAAEKIEPAPAENTPSESIGECLPVEPSANALYVERNGDYVAATQKVVLLTPTLYQDPNNPDHWSNQPFQSVQPSESVGAQELHEGARIVSSALLYLNHQTPKNWAAEGILNSLWGGLAKEYFETKYKPAPQQSESLAADELPLNLTEEDLTATMRWEPGEDHPDGYVPIGWFTCRERQLRSARIEIAHLRHNNAAILKYHDEAIQECATLRQRAEYAEGLIAAWEAGHKTDLQNIQDSYSSGSQSK